MSKTEKHSYINGCRTFHAPATVRSFFQRNDLNLIIPHDQFPTHCNIPKDVLYL